jgi:hypothetical protein
MKRLVDESTDELTRSLLAAGIEHRPPPGNKAQVIVAIGAGGALGLFSSNAFAWLGTAAGKVTAVGAAVGIAGAVFVAVPVLRGNGGEGARSSAALRGAASSARAVPTSEGSESASRSLSATSVPAPATSEQGAGAGRSASSNGALGNEDLGSEELGAGAAEQGVQGARAERKSARSREKRHVARGSRPSKRKAVASERAESGESAPSVASSTGAVAGASTEKDRLDAEVRLIDDMHWAARRNDREALARSVQMYRESFPDGQLKAEAAEFAARLVEPGDTP